MILEIIKRKTDIFVSLNLTWLQHNNGLETLSNIINKLLLVGFKNLKTSYNIGYYDAVEDIGLEFREELKNINLDLLTEYTNELNEKYK